MCLVWFSLCLLGLISLSTKLFGVWLHQIWKIAGHSLFDYIFPHPPSFWLQTRVPWMLDVFLQAMLSVFPSSLCFISSFVCVNTGSGLLILSSVMSCALTQFGIFFTQILFFICRRFLLVLYSFHSSPHHDAFFSSNLETFIRFVTVLMSPLWLIYHRCHHRVCLY